MKSKVSRLLIVDDNEMNRDMLARRLSRKGYEIIVVDGARQLVPKAQILTEPEQKNTAPAIGLAAHILQSIDKNSVMGVFPSDHVILKPRRYLQFVRQAFGAAEQGRISVLGIAPR